MIDNQINSLIDYGNLSNLIVNDRKYILLNNIIFSFKTNTLNDEINLYKNNVSNKIIMSGDHGRAEYDEVNIMKNYAIERGVKSEDIFMDHAGFSTYESIYRAKAIFKAKRIVIVTQKYHLYRALYIAKQLDLEVYGVGADPRQYVGATYREIREILARDKDFIKMYI